MLLLDHAPGGEEVRRIQAQENQREELTLCDQQTQFADYWAAAFVLDPDGVTRTKVLGSERMSRKLHEALPGGDEPLRAAVWTFLRPMLSPRLAELHRDAFVIGQAERSTVDLAGHTATPASTTSISTRRPTRWRSPHG